MLKLDDAKQNWNKQRYLIINCKKMKYQNPMVMMKNCKTLRLASV